MSGTIICAWAALDHRLDALVSALSALTYGRATCRVRGTSLRLGFGARDCTVAEAIPLVRELYGSGTAIEIVVDATLSAQRAVSVRINVFDDEYARTFPHYEPFLVDVHESLPLNEIEDLLTRVCASPHIITCANSIARTWPAPAEASATYNADGNVARDLAITWVHLREAARIRDIAGLSLNALHARVDAASPGASVGVAASLRIWGMHETEGWTHTERSRHKRTKRRGIVRDGPRAQLTGDAKLTREQLLAVLAAPTTTLLEALEAAAVPDEEGRAEPTSFEALRHEEDVVPNPEEELAREKYFQWIEQHAPYQVRRLPNGGAILTGHPYRVLWPLWADALSLLGIREST